MTQDFKKLNVWKKSHQLTLKVYKVSTAFPSDERYGLISQMRRSSASIPTNIAEGSGRQSTPDFVRFLQIAMGSASELEYQLILAHDLCYLPDPDYHTLTADLLEVKRMLASFMTRLMEST